MQVVTRFFLNTAIFVIIWLVELFINGCNFDLDDVFDINSIAQLLIVNLIALLVLTKKSFTAYGRLVLIFMSLLNATDLRNPR